MRELSRGDGEIRLSSADRDAAVARIQTAFAEGRLEDRELERRLREALGASILKGHLVIDLRAAALLSAETLIKVRGYKSTIEIIVPPGVEVDSPGFAYRGGWSTESDDEAGPRGRRTLRVRGIAYKSTVIIRRRPAPE